MKSSLLSTIAICLFVSQTNAVQIRQFAEEPIYSSDEWCELDTEMCVAQRKKENLV